MARTHFTPPFIIAILALLPTIQAWTYSTTNVNLAAPPIQNSGYVIENANFVNDHGQNDPGFPCWNFPVPADVHRTLWPIKNSTLTYDLTNNTVGSLQYDNYESMLYVGQISLGNGTTSTSTQAPGYQNVGETVWKNFQSGQQCGETFQYAHELVNVISSALGRSDNDLFGVEELEGMNATFGLRIVLFTDKPDYPSPPNPHLADYNMEEMFQCAYVTFTNADVSNLPDSGMCNGYRAANEVPGASVSSTSPTSSTTSSLGAPTTLQTSPTTLWTYSLSATPSSTSTSLPIGGSNAPTKSSSSSSHTLGIAVGVSVAGASLIIAALCFWFWRRRTARKLTGTIGADVMISRPFDDDNVKGEKGEKQNEKDAVVVESSGNSVHSEPLPVYSLAEEISPDYLRQSSMAKDRAV